MSKRWYDWVFGLFLLEGNMELIFKSSFDIVSLKLPCYNVDIKSKVGKEKWIPKPVKLLDN